MSSTIGEAARLDDRAAVLAHYEQVAAAAEYPKLLAVLADLYYGRTCKAVDGSARIVVANALGLTSPFISADRDLVWERYGNGFAWFEADLTKDRVTA